MWGSLIPIKGIKSFTRNTRNLHHNNIKKTWGVINDFIKSKATSRNVSITDENGNKYADNEIPNKFIEYYTSIADELTAEIPHNDCNASSYLGSRSGQFFQMSPISPIEVETVIENLKDNGNNPNNIATSVLSNSKHILSPIFCHLINLFVEQGYFPENLKVGCKHLFSKGGTNIK